MIRAARVPTMIEFFETAYLPLRLVGRAASTVEQYRLALARWEEFAGGAAAIEAVDDVLLAEFAAWRLSAQAGAAKTIRATTVNKDLRHLMAILRLAVERGALASMPKISKLPEEIEEPRAFLLDEIQRILAAAAATSGTIAGLPAGDYWVSKLLAIYDSGGRIGAIMAVAPPEVDLSAGTIHLRPGSQKQKRGQTLALHPQTVEACRRIWSSDRARMWPWPHCRGLLDAKFREILAAAEVETWNTTGSLFHRLRKSTASYLQAAGGDPVFQLGHSSASVTRRYLDPRICRQRAAELIPRPTMAADDLTRRREEREEIS